MELTAKAPAKVNLILDTPFRHQDGAPEWNMVMTAIDLADYIHLETIPDTMKITVQTDTSYLPRDYHNLAYQAAKTLQTRFNIHEGVTITIDKHIPVAAGMGGGSSDAAAVLRGLNSLWRLGLTTRELAQIGLTIDADVPFCVYGTPAHVTGRGEQVTPLKSLPPMWFVIAKPHDNISTPTILRQINYETLEHVAVAEAVQAIQTGELTRLFELTGNVLEPITAQVCPDITRIKTKMLQFGADAATMTGTGPTVLGICTKYSRAQHVYNALKGFCRDVHVVRPLQ